MNCPKCQSPMEPVTIEEIAVDRCTGCKGIWFDGKEYKALVDVKGAEVMDTGDVAVGRRMDQIRAINCPRCGVAMKEAVGVDHHHVTFETCGTCHGVFLDAGEFTDLKSYTFVDYVRGLFKHQTKK